MRTFTVDELSEFDGQNGKAAYVGFKGKVYEITGSEAWDDGNHMGLHQAGVDLTSEIDFAPHEEEFVTKYPVVGELA